MTRVEALLALDVGVEVADRAVAAGARCLVTGEMGIGNTTSATAIIAAHHQRAAHTRSRGGARAPTTRCWPASVASSRRPSTGSPRRRARSRCWSRSAASRSRPWPASSSGAPPPACRCVIDGVIADAALLIAAQLSPDVIDYVIAGHRSTEPAARAALEFLGLEPVLDLDLRLGEGTGAAMAVPVVQAAAKVLREMATFDSAGVAREKD